MPKQKTPLMELIEGLTQKAKECYEWGTIDTDGDAYMECVKLIKLKLPAERKMVEDTVNETIDAYHHYTESPHNDPPMNGSDYFTNKYGE